MNRLRRPKMMPDWDENRRLVINQYGEKFVLFKPQADVVFNAAMKVYHKRKRK